MVCQNCGKEMIKVGELTDKEYDDWIYICNMSDTNAQALDPNTINGMNFDDGQVFEYFRAVFEVKAKAAFLRHIFWRDLMKRLDISDKDIFIGDEPGSRELFVHPEE